MPREAAPGPAWSWCPEVIPSPAFESGSTVTVHSTSPEDGRHACTDGVLAVGLVDPVAGGLALEVPGDQAAVCVRETDPGGNRSPAAMVEGIEWVATLGGKVAGSPFENPHRYEARRWFTGTLVQHDGRRIGAGQGVESVGVATLETVGAGTWRRRATEDPGGRNNHASVYDSVRGQMVLVGGACAGGLCERPGETWEWDGVRWALRVPIDPEGDHDPPWLYGHAAAFDSRRGRLVLFGGDAPDWGVRSDQTWEWDGRSWARQAPTDPEGDGDPPASRNHALAYDSRRGRTVLFGGWQGERRANETWEWDGASWELMVPADPEGDGDPPPRICPALAYDAGREVTVLFGGQAADHGHLGDTWEWDGTSWHRRCDGLPAGDTCRRQPPRRWRHGLAYDGGRRRVVLYGGDGDDGRGILGGTWEWDGRDWTPIIPDDPEGDGDPSPRSSASLAYHGARGGVVLYGGADDAGATADIIWVWDGWSWARTGPVDPERDGDPPAYDEPALCYDSATRRTVLWSRGSSGSLEGPWDWDGVSWALGAPEDPEGDGGPARRFERRRCRLDYDSVRARTVLFSGAFPSVATWEWNGESWALRAPADPEQDGNPSPRQAFAVVFDSQRGQLVLFGGWHEDEPFGDTWEWDGTSWALRAPADPEGDGEPPGRAGHALAFDSRRSVVVLFGGTPDWDQPLDDTWEWDGGATSRPGQTLHVSLAAAALPPSPVWETLTATLLAGGRGHADGVQHGAELHLWDEGRWRRVGRNDRPPDDPGPLEWTTADPDLVRRLLFGQDQSVNLAVLPLAPNGTGTASVAVDYAEVRVRYRLSP